MIENLYEGDVMEYWENVKKTTADMSYKVVKKTEELVEASKIKYRIYDVKTQIEKLHAQIGKEVYEAYADGREVSVVIEDKCREIDALNEKLNDLTDMLQK
ncbi:MAG: hypothetical protein IJN96_04360 [Clostridia bacterium]|nr:hypothetical protein [Clostridia bacterium]